MAIGAVGEGARRWMEGMDWLWRQCRRHRHVGPPLRCVPQALSRALSDVSAVSRVLPCLRRINNASSDLVDRFPNCYPNIRTTIPPKKLQNGVWLSFSPRCATPYRPSLKRCVLARTLFTLGERVLQGIGGMSSISVSLLFTDACLRLLCISCILSYVAIL